MPEQFRPSRMTACCFCAGVSFRESYSPPPLGWARGIPVVTSYLASALLPLPAHIFQWASHFEYLQIEFLFSPSPVALFLWNSSDPFLTMFSSSVACLLSLELSEMWKYVYMYMFMCVYIYNSHTYIFVIFILLFVLLCKSQRMNILFWPLSLYCLLVKYQITTLKWKEERRQFENL